MVHLVDAMTDTLTRDHSSVPQLRDFAAEGYEPPVQEYSFGNLRVLALDQALAHTGLVEVAFDGPNFEVMDHETLVMENDLAGNTAVLKAGAWYFDKMRQVLMDHMVLGIAQVVVFELPPNAFAMRRPESSMMAALCLTILCDQLNFENHMVQRQAACTLWAANPKANKTQLKRGILEKFPFLQQSMAKGTEHEWDALALAMTYALGKPHA